MLFNSVDFAIFLPIIFLLYWFTTGGNRSRQNVLLLLASYFFYGWWDWRFLLLIAFSTVVDFLIGTQLGKTDDRKRRRRLLWISLTVNLGLLAYFKYANFFIDNFVAAFRLLGGNLSSYSLEIILPVGISFYTFQTLSYTIDVYRGKLSPSRDLLSFASFVSFFPQLVAGPIERASDLLPQFLRKRQFAYAAAADGLRQILWGLFKKIVIADNCAEYVNRIFTDADQLGGSTLLIGAILFSLQIYGDFSGYSDIAIGTSRLFGFRLRQNFATPYFSRDIAEFWRRWHISLSTWFRDYLYIPLGGSRRGTIVTVRNVFVVFLVSSLWHGASWNFVVWGGIHAFCFLPLLLTSTNRRNLGVVSGGRRFPTLREVLSILVTFLIVTLAWVFFRAEGLGAALDYLVTIFSSSLLERPSEFLLDSKGMSTLVMIVFFFMVEWIGRESRFAIAGISRISRGGWRWLFYLFVVLLIYFFGAFDGEVEFIYFQF